MVVDVLRTGGVGRDFGSAVGWSTGCVERGKGSFSLYLLLLSSFSQSIFSSTHNLIYLFRAQSKVLPLLQTQLSTLEIKLTQLEASTLQQSDKGAGGNGDDMDAIEDQARRLSHELGLTLREEMKAENELSVLEVRGEESEGGERERGLHEWFLSHSVTCVVLVFRPPTKRSNPFTRSLRAR
jgi:hypothetical protein